MNLGQAFGSMSAGGLFALQSAAPFWTAAGVLLVGAALTLIVWGPARTREIADANRAAGGATPTSPTLNGHSP